MHIYLIEVLNELVVIKESHISTLEILLFDMMVMPWFLSILFHLLMKICDEPILRKL